MNSEEPIVAIHGRLYIRYNVVILEINMLFLDRWMDGWTFTAALVLSKSLAVLVPNRSSRSIAQFAAKIRERIKVTRTNQ